MNWEIPQNGVFWGAGDADSNADDQLHVCLGHCPSKLLLINVSTSTARYTVFWLRSMGCLSSDLMEGLAYYRAGASGTAAYQADLADNEGVACYDGGDKLKFDAAQDRWEVESSVTPGTWIDATSLYVDECGDCIMPKRNPTPVNGVTVLAPRGFRVGYDSLKLNLDGEEIHYEAVFGKFCDCDETPGGNTIDGGTEAARQ